MRRIFAILKKVLVLVLFFIVFIKVWDPIFSNITNKAITIASININKNIETKYLSEITDSIIVDDITVFNTHEETVISGTQILQADARIIAMRQFLIDQHSPLYPYADIFVTEADKADLDWRLVASISGVESAFGRIIPYRTNNAWGWKGDPTRDWSYFTSWREGITTVTSRIAIGYGTDTTPFRMEAVYCPPCGRNPAHAWANGVTRYMNILEEYRANLE